VLDAKNTNMETTNTQPNILRFLFKLDALDIVFVAALFFRLIVD
jgi:hypothetical protein